MSTLGQEMEDNHDETMRSRIVRLAFRGDEHRFQTFIDALRRVTPKGGEVILRGSAVTGSRWSDGQPFDAEGPGTSDLDVTFLAADLVGLWNAFYIPGLHTVPLSEEHPDACPALNELREGLCDLAGRPVNLQASTSLVQFARDVLFDQPYYTLIDSDRGGP
ncbi:MAG: hypothetical protein WEE89_01765 [Gemmatimonadota bacterium]